MQPSRYEQKIRNTIASSRQEMAVDIDGDSYSWAQFAAVAGKVEELLDGLAMPSGAHIGLIGRNRPAQFAALIGTFLASRCVSMVYAFQSPASLAADIAGSRWPVMFGERADWTPEVIAAADLIGAVGFAFSPNGDAHFECVTANDLPDPSLLDPDAGDTTLQLLSSGTTGTPKRISLSRVAVDEMIERTIFQFEMSGPGDTGSGPKQTQIIPWPIVSLGGTNALLPAMALGQSIAIQERFDAAGMLELIRKYRPAFLSLPPVGIARILQLNPAKEDLACIKLYFSGTAALDPNVRRRMMDEYGIMVAEAYGATEFAGIISSWMPEDLPLTREKAGSVGRALPGIDIRVVSPETGEPLPQGESGLIEALVPRVSQEWVRTNDVARLDEDGFVFLEGRADDAIVRGGFKIVPEEVAEVLRTHPGVGDAALIGITDERGESVPAAAIEPRAGQAPPNENELEGYLRDRLPGYKIPARWAIVEKIPRTQTLKPQRDGMRALFADR